MGFKELVTDVGLGLVGIVIGLEVSRLARNCTDFGHLAQVLPPPRKRLMPFPCGSCHACGVNECSDSCPERIQLGSYSRKEKTCFFNLIYLCQSACPVNRRYVSAQFIP
ncbi:hypothetical protein [Desulfonatronospira sp.]|uniref:hypothetical protein n=1 Tax=Desulfonatronospira sp. TaxID=1962951 RepID=UPI0025BE2339|nr:hypothetical protein [Desulfonatronospira sp.]